MHSGAVVEAALLVRHEVGQRLAIELTWIVVAEKGFSVTNNVTHPVCIDGVSQQMFAVIRLISCRPSAASVVRRETPFSGFACMKHSRVNVATSISHPRRAWNECGAIFMRGGEITLKL